VRIVKVAAKSARRPVRLPAATPSDPATRTGANDGGQLLRPRGLHSGGCCVQCLAAPRVARSGYSHYWLQAVEQRAKVILRQLAVTQDLGEKSRANGFTAVHRYDGSSSVRMTKEMMASPDSHIAEACTVEYSDQIFTRQARKPCHEPIETFWIPTKSSVSVSPPCSSTHSAIASRILSMT
jgi:hypothetical protein